MSLPGPTSFTTLLHERSFDSRYFIRLKQLSPGEAEVNKYKNATAQVWELKSDPVSVAGNGIGNAKLSPDEFPAISINPGAPMAMLVSINGVQNELKAWTAPGYSMTR